MFKISDADISERVETSPFWSGTFGFGLVPGMRGWLFHDDLTRPVLYMYIYTHTHTLYIVECQRYENDVTLLFSHLSFDRPINVTRYSFYYHPNKLRCLFNRVANDIIKFWHRFFLLRKFLTISFLLERSSLGNTLRKSVQRVVVFYDRFVVWIVG